MVEEHPAAPSATRAAANAPLLRAEALSRRFGGVQAVRDVSFDVEAGEVVGLIGPNGSGKSTCVNLLSGTIAPTGGRVLMAGAALGGARIEQAVARGVVRTF